MSNGRPEPRWPKVLSLTVHEFRTPMTVVAGYIRMLLKERAGPLSDAQRHLLTEAERSCTRLSGLLGELSELSGLEGGTATINRSPVDVRPLLEQIVTALPPLPDREVHVELSTGDGPAVVEADPTRLSSALSSVIVALRRELVTSDRLSVRERTRSYDGRTVSWIVIADPSRMDALSEAGNAALTTFDEWRGGCGLSLPVGRRIIEAHGARIWSPIEQSRAGAVIALPLAG
jgi:signal transduction histidine kinase